MASSESLKGLLATDT